MVTSKRLREIQVVDSQYIKRVGEAHEALTKDLEEVERAYREAKERVKRERNGELIRAINSAIDRGISKAEISRTCGKTGTGWIYTLIERY